MNILPWEKGGGGGGIATGYLDDGKGPVSNKCVFFYYFRDVTRYLRLLLRKEGFTFRTSSELEIIRQIKEVLYHYSNFKSLWIIKKTVLILKQIL